MWQTCLCGHVQHHMCGSACSHTPVFCLVGGFSTRPFVRSVQRQSLSSRSSVTSPLAVSENGIRPSWSLSTKLQMRSNSPSRFSGDSPVHNSASTLERIGESADDKVSISCFGSLRSLSGGYVEPSEHSSSRQEHRAVGRAPLAVMEGVFRDEKPARKSGLCTDSYVKNAVVQTDSSGPALDPFDNNNQIAFVDQSDSVESSPVKEGRGFGGAELPPDQAESAPSKAVNPKDACEPDRSLRKGRTVLSSQDSLTSRQSAVSPPPAKTVLKASRSRSKADSCRPSGRHGSPALGQSRKEASSRPRETPSTASQQKQKSLSSSSASTRRNSAGASGRSQAVASKSRTSDRSLSREGSKASLGSDKAGGTLGSRTESPRTSQVRGDGRTPDGKHVRSSSMASLHSPPAGPRSSLKRDSKSEDKGLSFFKSALRQKETRRSADLGKTTLLSKKMAGSSSRAAGKNLPEDKLDKSQPLPRSTPAAGPASKDSSPAKHTLLMNRKLSRSSQPEATPQSPSSSRPAGEKPPRSKLPPSMPASARPSSKPQ